MMSILFLKFDFYQQIEHVLFDLETKIGEHIPISH